MNPSAPHFNPPQPAPPRRGAHALLLFLGLGLIGVGVFVVGFFWYVGGNPQEGLGLLGDRVAVVEIHGALIDVEDWVELLEQCVEEDRIAAVVLDIDSPGGAIAPTQQLCRAVDKIKEKGKPVIAALGSVAASGGYYVACSADEIVAMPGTLTGSIGVYVQLLNITDLLEKIGVEFDFIKKGEMKTAGDFSRPLKEEERRMFQSVVDDYYRQFLEAVLAGRKQNRLSLARGWNTPVPGSLPEGEGRVSDLGGLVYPSPQWNASPISSLAGGVVTESSRSAANGPLQSASPGISTQLPSGGIPAASEVLTASAASSLQQLANSLSEESIETRVAELAEGRIYTGRQALDLGLVDELGTLDDAVEKAARQADLDPETKTLKKAPREGGGFFGSLDLEAKLLRGSKFLYLCPFAY